MSGPISSDRIGGPDFSPLPGSNPEAGKSTEASTVSRGLLTSAEGVTVSRDGAAVTTAGNAAGQAHRLDVPSQVLTPSNFATAQGEVGELLFDFQPPQQRTGQPKKNPVVALAALAGELTPEELETESAGGSQQKLERNHKDKSQARKAAGGVDEQAKAEIESDKLARQSIPALANHDTSSEEAYVDIYQVMAVMHKMANSNRRMTKESRAVSYEAAKNEILNQAEEMKAAATKRFIGAVVQNAAQIASAGVSLGALKGADPGSAQIASARATAAGSAVTGAGGLASAAFNFEASKHDAKMKEHEAYQKTYENAAQSDTEFMNAMQDMVRSVQSAMAEIIRAKHETEKSIIRS